MKKVAIFDLDGTLFRWQLFHELVFELGEMKALDDKTVETLEQSLIEWQTKRRSWHDYEMTIVDAMESNVAAITPELFEEAAHNVVERSGQKIYAYTKRLADKLKSNGYYLLAISGSQQEIAEPFAKLYGFDDCIGALYERIDGKFTGKKVRHVPGNKHEIIKNYLREHPDLTLTDSVAVGDSNGDISMLHLAENPIAFNPSEELLDEANENNWQVVIERKNIAYTLKKDSDGSFVLAKTDRF